MVIGVAGVVLFGTFLVSASRKLMRPPTWHRLLRQYGLPRTMRYLAFITIPWLEVGVAVVGVLVAPRSAALVSLVLLVAFIAAILRLRGLSGTERVPCGCFGDEVMRDYRLLIARNIGLSALALVVVTTAPPSALVDLEPAGEVGAVACVAVASTLWAARQGQKAMRRRAERAVVS